MSENTGAAPNAAPSAPADSSGAPAQGDVSTNSQVAQAPAENAQVDAIQDAVESGELSQAEANKMIKKYQLKVRGKTVEREFDLGDENAVKNMLQLAEVSKMSQQEKAELEKRFEQILQNGKQDPMDFIAKAFGIDPDELAALHIEKKIEHLKKSPEVLEREKIQAELAEAREKLKRIEQEKDSAELSKMQSEQLQTLQTEISSAIKAHTKLPDTQYVQEEMAKAMLWATNNGYENVTAEDVAMVVEEEMKRKLNGLFDLMPEEALESYAGRKNIERLRKSKIAKAKEVPSVNAVKPTAGNAEPQKNVEQARMDAKKFWRGR